MGFMNILILFSVKHTSMSKNVMTLLCYSQKEEKNGLININLKNIFSPPSKNCFHYQKITISNSTQNDFFFPSIWDVCDGVGNELVAIAVLQRAS